MNALRSIGLDIGNEVRDQNRLLGDLDSDFENSTGPSLFPRLGPLLWTKKSGRWCRSAGLDDAAAGDRLEERREPSRLLSRRLCLLRLPHHLLDLLLQMISTNLIIVSFAVEMHIK